MDRHPVEVRTTAAAMSAHLEPLVLLIGQQIQPSSRGVKTGSLGEPAREGNPLREKHVVMAALLRRFLWAVLDASERQT